MPILNHDYTLPARWNRVGRLISTSKSLANILSAIQTFLADDGTYISLI